MLQLIISSVCSAGHSANPWPTSSSSTTVILLLFSRSSSSERKALNQRQGSDVILLLLRSNTRRAVNVSSPERDSTSNLWLRKCSSLSVGEDDHE